MVVEGSKKAGGSPQCISTYCLPWQVVQGEITTWKWLVEEGVFLIRIDCVTIEDAIGVNPILWRSIIFCGEVRMYAGSFDFLVKSTTSNRLSSTLFTFACLRASNAQYIHTKYTVITRQLLLLLL